jgi:hypothetical protein
MTLFLNRGSATPTATKPQGLPLTAVNSRLPPQKTPWELRLTLEKCGHWLRRCRQQIVERLPLFFLANVTDKPVRDFLIRPDRRLLDGPASLSQFALSWKGRGR